MLVFICRTHNPLWNVLHALPYYYRTMNYHVKPLRIPSSVSTFLIYSFYSCVLNVVFIIVILYWWVGSDTLVIVFWNFNVLVFIFCISPPWRWPQLLSNLVGVYCVYKLFSYTCVHFVGIAVIYVWWIWVCSSGGMIVTGKPKYSEKPVPILLFRPQISYGLPGFESGPLRLEAGD